MPQSAEQLTGQLLKDVSRSFYLTLRALPGGVRQQIGLAYLLARATDTIADTEALPVNRRLDALDALRRKIQGESAVALDLSDAAQGQADDGEKRLLTRIPEALQALEATNHDDRLLIQEVLRVITSGQELDLRRFGGVKPGEAASLDTAAELDDYTYRVAGCVGEFWTKICFARLSHGRAGDSAALLPDAIRFGKGLQLVNILRDLPRDLRQGRCYIPLQSLRSAGLAPRDLLDPARMKDFAPVYRGLLAQAMEHLRAGWGYTLALPGGWVRVRLACAWPVLIGVGTLEKLGNANVLDESQRVKISRKEVRTILLQTVFYLPFPRIWRQLPGQDWDSPAP